MWRFMRPAFGCAFSDARPNTAAAAVAASPVKGGPAGREQRLTQKEFRLLLANLR